MSYVKFRVYVPPENLEQMRDAVRPVIAKSDKYMGAMTWYPVKSAWTTLPGAKPCNGTVGEETVAAATEKRQAIRKNSSASAKSGKAGSTKAKAGKSDDNNAPAVMIKGKGNYSKNIIRTFSITE